MHTIRLLLIALAIVVAPAFIVTPAVWSADEAAPLSTAVDEHATTTPLELDAAGAHTDATHHGEAEAHGERPIPNVFWVWPFVALLLSIAILPLVPATAHWWHRNSSKLIVALILSAVTILYYYSRSFGFPHGEHATETGMPAVLAMLHHAVLADYIPFIVLLFSLYCISGGINLRGDIRATPLNNTIFIGIGTVLANFIGTTGSAMLLIRPLLQINRERHHVRHTVIFFIFLCCNIGGCLLPIGDPPLFLGYLRGVPFLWTFRLWVEWVFMFFLVLTIYYIWDTVAWKKEAPQDIALDRTQIEPLKIIGRLNFLWLLGIVLAVAFLVPGKPFFGMFVVPNFLREGVMLTLVAVAWITTAPSIREANKFNFEAIGEVACLFIGIFIAMQVPVEILNLTGPSLGLDKPWQFFWATGMLSSFLDNAPTYVVFFETAKSLPAGAGPTLQLLGGAHIDVGLLTAISIGAVFMGANTYIGNGPNFMVKSIAESSGVKMPSFFGYMIFSGLILIPCFIVITFVFLH